MHDFSGPGPFCFYWAARQYEPILGAQPRPGTSTDSAVARDRSKARDLHERSAHDVTTCSRSAGHAEVFILYLLSPPPLLNVVSQNRTPHSHALPAATQPHRSVSGSGSREYYYKLSAISAETHTETSQVARQVFRRHEVYSLRAQILLLFVPPGVVALHATRLPSSIWTFFEAFWLSLAIYVAALLIATVVYRLSPWHPLATYPGPALRKVSELVSAYYVATGRKGTHLRTLHEQYGDIVRIGMPYSNFRFR